MPPMLPAANRKLFAVQPDPVERESRAQKLKPRQEQKKELIYDKWLSREKAAAVRDGDQAKLNALALIETEHDVEMIDGQIDKEFAEDFRAWLQGRGRLEDHVREKTPWGRIPLAFPDVMAYTTQFVEKKADFEKKMKKLREFGPKNLNEAYLYFKYIVRNKTRPDLAYYPDFNWVTDLEPPNKDPTTNATNEYMTYGKEPPLTLETYRKKDFTFVINMKDKFHSLLGTYDGTPEQIFAYLDDPDHSDDPSAIAVVTEMEEAGFSSQDMMAERYWFDASPDEVALYGRDTAISTEDRKTLRQVRDSINTLSRRHEKLAEAVRALDGPTRAEFLAMEARVVENAGKAARTGNKAVVAATERVIRQEVAKLREAKVDRMEVDSIQTSNDAALNEIKEQVAQAQHVQTTILQGLVTMDASLRQGMGEILDKIQSGASDMEVEDAIAAQRAKEIAELGTKLHLKEAEIEEMKKREQEIKDLQNQMYTASSSQLAAHQAELQKALEHRAYADNVIAGLQQRIDELGTQLQHVHITREKEAKSKEELVADLERKLKDKNLVLEATKEVGGEVAKELEEEHKFRRFQEERVLETIANLRADFERQLKDQKEVLRATQTAGAQAAAELDAQLRARREQEERTLQAIGERETQIQQLSQHNTELKAKEDFLSFIKGYADDFQETNQGMVSLLTQLQTVLAQKVINAPDKNRERAVRARGTEINEYITKYTLQNQNRAALLFDTLATMNNREELNRRVQEIQGERRDLHERMERARKLINDFADTKYY